MGLEQVWQEIRDPPHWGGVWPGKGKALCAQWTQQRAWSPREKGLQGGGQWSDEEQGVPGCI